MHARDAYMLIARVSTYICTCRHRVTRIKGEGGEGGEGGESGEEAKILKTSWNPSRKSCFPFVARCADVFERLFATET